jgi:carbamoyl-phosphate synthase large subunit
MSNVLITSAGRRTTLVRAFREVVNARGGLVWAGDMDPLAPALFLADRTLRLPPVNHPDYLPFLLETAAEHQIRLIVPTIDTELLPLSQAAGRFEEQGCRALVSAEGLVRISRDKWTMVEVFRGRGFRVPRSWLPEHVGPDELPEQLFIKPRDGSASKHAYAVSRDQLSRLLDLVPNAIIQERLTGPEITVDALLDFDGRPLHFVPRRRIRTLGGESIQGVTLSARDLTADLMPLLEAIGSLGGRGPITVQLFRVDGQLVLSEINARFGGGIPLTLAAGGAYPEWIWRLLHGEILEPRLGDYREGLYMTRHYVELFRQEPLWT